MLQHEWTVQQKDRLRRHRGNRALFNDGRRIGRIKQAPEIVGIRTNGHQIKRSPIVLDLPDGRTAQGKIQAATRRQQAIAQRFDGQTLAVHPAEKLVVRIRFQCLRIRDAGLLVNGREHDRSVHRFHRPAGFNEPVGQVVE